MYFNETTGSMRSVISFTNQKIHFNMTSLDSIVDIDIERTINGSGKGRNRVE